MHLRSLLLVAAMLFILSGCAATGGGAPLLLSGFFDRLGSETGQPTLSGQAIDPRAVPIGEGKEAEEGDEEKEEDEPLDGWLQAYLYRSPSYQLSLPERPNRLREALKTAFELRGTSYRAGGISEQGLDCSGLVSVSFASAGIKLPRTSEEQFHATERIARDALKPGDLVFFKTGRNKKRAIDHVGIYVGNGQFLHAPRQGKTVSLASLADDYWQRRYRGAGRVPGASPMSEELAMTEASARLAAASEAGAGPVPAVEEEAAEQLSLAQKRPPSAETRPQRAAAPTASLPSATVKARAKSKQRKPAVASAAAKRVAPPSPKGRPVAASPPPAKAVARNTASNTSARPSSAAVATSATKPSGVRPQSAARSAKPTAGKPAGTPPKSVQKRESPPRLAAQP